MTHLLIVDDDRIQRTISSRFLTDKLDCEIAEAESGEIALKRLKDKNATPVDLVLLDLYMPGLDGRETLAQIRILRPELPVIMLTASNELEDAVELMRLGASDFITKPFTAERLKVAVEQQLSKKFTPGGAKLKSEGAQGFGELIGATTGLAHQVSLGRKAANSDIPVLITGPSGSGKELLARAIHGESPRSAKPFIAINCGAIPENLVESTLFGHEKGSFTGAIAREIGKFREADGGTLFLDEVGELKRDMQTKLLRALQQKEIEPVGAGKAVPVNARIISATNRNLTEDVAAGWFRDDLYYRLNVFPVHMPPLAARADDIPAIAEHMIARFCAMEHKAHIRISSSGMQWLRNQRWQGNVRELENLLYRAVVLSDQQELGDTDFAQMTGETASVHIPVSHYNHITLVDNNGRVKSFDEIEEEVILATLKRCGDNVPEAARLLGMGQSTLYKRLSGKVA